MIDILVCDDDRAFLRRQETEIFGAMERLGVDAKVSGFSGGEQIPDTVLENCGLAFLDIDFPRADSNGIDIARRLRQVNRDAVIVFVTNFVEYAPEGYEVQAFRYLLKKEVPEKLEQCLALALERLRSRQKTYAVQSGGNTVHLPIEDILYVESQRHTAIAYVRQGDSIQSCAFYASLRSVEEALAPCGFLRVQKSYLVNMRHIRKYQFREVVLTGDISLPASSKIYAQQKEKFLFWKGRQ